MADRAVILLVIAALTVLAMSLYSLVRRRQANPPERLDIDELGLAMIEGCCAFVVFTTPTCRPCAAVLRVVRAAIDGRRPPTDVVTVDAVQRADLASRYSVRTVPTTFLITASGHVVERWVDVPARADVEHAVSTAAGAGA